MTFLHHKYVHTYVITNLGTRELGIVFLFLHFSYYLFLFISKSRDIVIPRKIKLRSDPDISFPENNVRKRPATSKETTKRKSWIIAVKHSHTRQWNRNYAEMFHHPARSLPVPDMNLYRHDCPRHFNDLSTKSLFSLFRATNGALKALTVTWL